MKSALECLHGAWIDTRQNFGVESKSWGWLQDMAAAVVTSPMSAMRSEPLTDIVSSICEAQIEALVQAYVYHRGPRAFGLCE